MADPHAMLENEFWVITGLPKQGKSHLARRLTRKHPRVLVFDPTSTIQGKERDGKRTGAFPGIVTEDFKDFENFVDIQRQVKSGFRVALIDKDVIHLEKWMQLVLDLQDVPAMQTPEFPLVIWIEEAALAMPQVPGKETGKSSKLLAKILRIRQHLRTTIIITTQYAEDTPRQVRKQSEIFISFQQVTGDNITAIREKGMPREWIDEIPRLKVGDHLIQRGRQVVKVRRDGSLQTRPAP